MSRNDELRQGDSLTSNNGEWKAVFQEDTNFVIYGTKPVWASDTYGLDGIRLCLQDDCNLVMYNQRHQIIWSTNSQEPKCKMCHLQLTDEGKLVISRDGEDIWTSDENKGKK